jgi:hypothetical protein
MHEKRKSEFNCGLICCLSHIGWTNTFDTERLLYRYLCCAIYSEVQARYKGIGVGRFQRCNLISFLLYDVMELRLVFQRFNTNKERPHIRMPFYGVDPGVNCVKFNEL